LNQEKLRHLLLPLGKYSKLEVKKLAKEKELPVSLKPSQDLCFVSDKNYRTFLTQRFSPKPGDIVYSSGEILGHHQGIAFYTIGQRRGLGTAWGKPFYVIRIEPDDNLVVLGTKEELYTQEAIAQKVNWITGTPPTKLSNINAKIRYRSLETPVTLSPKGESINVWFPQPQRAVTPGQAIVFYDGDEVLGGGIIENFSPISPTERRKIVS
jgi:tRNA-specific 2-thiouridylase